MIYNYIDLPENNEILGFSPEITNDYYHPQVALTAVSNNFSNSVVVFLQWYGEIALFGFQLRNLPIPMEPCFDISVCSYFS